MTWMQKLSYGGVTLVILLALTLFGGYLTGVAGQIAFMGFAVILGLITWFVSAGWSYRLEISQNEIMIRDTGRKVVVPLDKVGMLARNGGFPFPTLWLVLKNSESGFDIPKKGVDPQTRAMIEAYLRRNPGKKLTVVSLPGGYLRSIPEFTAELKRRIPPLTVDERLVGK